MKRHFQVTVNGETFNVEVEELGRGFDYLQPVIKNQSKKSTFIYHNDIPNQRPHIPQNDFTVTAPLPGTVVDVWVKPGQKVSQGQVLLIIEAMKMENEIQAPFDGVVHEIMVQAGSSVTGGQPLVRLGH
ncbi:hypothetical protein MHOCP_12120 [Moorella humiferrea]|uniref:biotin/lipoyl-containing protein n=1 Tax=Neomoorella humiferrea TaxID=676965 RepID=UPI0030CCD9DC